MFGGGHFLIAASVPCPAAWPPVLTVDNFDINTLKNLLRHYATAECGSEAQTGDSEWTAKILEA